MAVTIKHAYVCPRCEEGITADFTDPRCPKCGLGLGTSTRYVDPLTLDEQRMKLKDPGAHLRAVLELKVVKALSVLQDALNIIETLSVKKASIADIRPMIEMGMSIGNIATAYDAFIRAGGKHVPSVQAMHEEQVLQTLAAAVAPKQESQEKEDEHDSKSGAGNEDAPGATDYARARLASLTGGGDLSQAR